MRIIAIATASLMLASCATAGGGTQTADTWVPSLSRGSRSEAVYQKDLAECRAVAKGTPGTDVAQEQKKGMMRWGIGGLAVMGAATVMTGGAALAVLPAMAAPAAMTAGTAAATGGMTGGIAADGKFKTAMQNCMMARGYGIGGL